MSVRTPDRCCYTPNAASSTAPIFSYARCQTLTASRCCLDRRHRSTMPSHPGPRLHRRYRSRRSCWDTRASKRKKARQFMFACREVDTFRRSGWITCPILRTYQYKHFYTVALIGTSFTYYGSAPDLDKLERSATSKPTRRSRRLITCLVSGRQQYMGCGLRQKHCVRAGSHACSLAGIDGCVVNVASVVYVRGIQTRVRYDCNKRNTNRAAGKNTRLIYAQRALKLVVERPLQHQTASSRSCARDTSMEGEPRGQGLTSTKALKTRLRDTRLLYGGAREQKGPTVSRMGLHKNN